MNQQVPIYNNTNIKPIQNYNNYNNSYPNSGQQSFYNQNYHQNYIPNQKMYYPNGQNNQEENPLKTFNNYTSNYNRISTVNVTEIEPKTNFLQRKEIKEEIKINTEEPKPANENDFRIENSTLATIFAGKSQENEKICSKLLKESLTENIIEREKKLFSSLFTGEKCIGDPLNFSKIKIFFMDENKLSDQKTNNEKSIKTVKNDLLLIGKKRFVDLVNRRNLNEKINKIQLSKNLLKIKQNQIQTKLDEIFSDI